jgi:putative flippase GtrA
MDFREFARFVVGGGLATIGNLCTVWVARTMTSFNLALVCGIGVGITISFLMSKFFAFRSTSWSGSRGEAMRFLLVHGAGLLCYWAAAVGMRKLLSMHVSSAVADVSGVLTGSAVMVFTGYFGHRLFTYRNNVPR